MYLITEKISGENIDISEEMIFAKSHNGLMVRCEAGATFAYMVDSDMIYGLAAYSVVEMDIAPEGATVNATKRTASARAQRDALLVETDWTQCLDAPISATSVAEMRTYRQSLRDITEQEGFPFEVVWPDVPTVEKDDPDPVDEAFDEMVGGEDDA